MGVPLACARTYNLDLRRNGKVDQPLSVELQLRAILHSLSTTEKYCLRLFIYLLVPVAALVRV